MASSNDPRPRVHKRVLAKLRRDPDIERLRRRGMQIGRGVDIGRDCYLAELCPWLLTIGDGVTVGMHVSIYTHDNSSKIAMGYTQVSAVTLEDEAYVGAFSVLLPGVTVGRGAIVGANSVVSRDVPAGAVAAGSPATVVGDVAAFAERHRRGLEGGPVYEQVWANGAFDPDRVPEELRRRMRDELGRGRRGYIP